jgi:hypothetical protein
MANLSTKSNFYSNSIVLTTTDVKAFLLSLHFSNNFKQLLYRKNILVTQFTLNLNSNRIDFYLNLYYRKKKLIKFRKAKLQKNQISVKKNENIYFFLLKYFKDKFNINTLNLKVKVLNRLIIFSFFFKHLKTNLKFFKKSLFERRLNLYFDFLKIIALYQVSQVSLDAVVMLLAEIFQRLSKKKHGVFIKFIKVLFKNIFLDYNSKSFYNRVKGAKFILAGKVKGKLRAKTTSMFFGSVPISTQSKAIHFAKCHVYTIYGTYGIKLWVYQELTAKRNLNKVLEHVSKLKKTKRFVILKRKSYLSKSKKVFNTRRNFTKSKLSSKSNFKSQKKSF